MPNTAPQQHNGNDLVVIAHARPSDLMVNDERRSLLRNAIMKGATDAQVDLIVQIGNRYGLDPLLGHIVLIDGKPFVTHKGLFHVAHASGQFDGYETTYGADTMGDYCQCLVWRKDMTRPLQGRIYVAEYNNKRGAWAQYPRAMAAKVAESFVLRRAFDVSLTAEDEMSHSAEPAPPQSIRDAQRQRAQERQQPPVFESDPAPAPALPAPSSADADINRLKVDINAGITMLAGEQRTALTGWMTESFATTSLRGMNKSQLQAIVDKMAEIVKASEAVTEAAEDDPFADAPEPGGAGAS